MRDHAVVGAHCFLHVAKTLRVRCRIADVDTKKRLCKIEAIEGDGCAWVSPKRLELCYPTAASVREVRHA